MQHLRYDFRGSMNKLEIVEEKSLEIFKVISPVLQKQIQNEECKQSNLDVSTHSTLMHISVFIR